MGARVGVHPKLEFYWESMQINTITGTSPPTTQIWDERSRFSEDGIARGRGATKSNQKKFLEWLLKMPAPLIGPV